MKKASIVISIFLCFALALGQIRIFKKVAFPKRLNHENNRIHLNTGNTIRITGNSSKDIGTKVTDILFPYLNNQTKPEGVIIIKGDRWQDVLALMPLVKEYNIPIIPFNSKDEKDVLNYIKSINPKGISSLQDTQVILCGSNIDAFKGNLEKQQLRVSTINYKDTNSLLGEVYKKIFSSEKKIYGFIVSDEDPFMTVPVSTWINENGGVPLYLNSKKQLYNSSKNILPKLSKVYILGKKNNGSEDLVKNLKIPYKIVSGYNAENFAINFAKFYDKDQGFGFHSNRSRDDSNHNFILCSKNEPTLALVSSQLALKGKAGPILWTDKNKLSPLTENYLWRMKPNYWVTPAEGPFNNLWVIGDNNILPFSIQAKADYVEEIEDYKTMGSGGVSALDAISIIFSFISILGALWITLHLFYRRAHLSVLIKLMWILTVLILGPVGIWLYIICYINSPWIKMNGKVIWLRSLWKQTSVSTLSGLAFEGATIIVVNYILTYMGSPLIPFYARYGVYLLGNPMIIKIILSYIIAFLLNIFIFAPSMLMEMKDLQYKDAVKEALPIEFISFTTFFIGMILSMWWLNMVYSPNMLREDNILWFGFMTLSVFAGFLNAYVANWILVRKGKKMGVM